MLPLVALLACLIASGCAAGRPPAPSQSAAPCVLPAVPVLTLDGQPTTVPREAGGRVTLVSLWATWCEPCLAEFPALERFASRAGPHARALAVAVGEPRPRVAEFVSARGLRDPQRPPSLPILVDEEFRFADAAGQRRVPATLVADAGGRVVYSGGAFDEAALDAVRALLGEGTRAPRRDEVP